MSFRLFYALFLSTLLNLNIFGMEQGIQQNSSTKQEQENASGPIHEAVFDSLLGQTNNAKHLNKTAFKIRQNNF